MERVQHNRQAAGHTLLLARQCTRCTVVMTTDREGDSSSSSRRGLGWWTSCRRCRRGPTHDGPSRPLDVSTRGSRRPQITTRATDCQTFIFTSLAPLSQPRRPSFPTVPTDRNSHCRLHPDRKFTALVISTRKQRNSNQIFTVILVELCMHTAYNINSEISLILCIYGFNPFFTFLVVL